MGAYDYLASDGTTTMWDASATAPDFDHNVVVIGTDNSNGFGTKDFEVAKWRWNHYGDKWC